jgi:hypothetical protein
VNLYLSVFIVLGAMALGGVFIALAARRSPEGSLADRTPTNVYAVTGGAVSLLIAFTFAAAFGMYTNVQTQLRTEAAELLSMYRATNFMEEPLRASLRQDVQCYAQLVSTVEWQDLSEGNVSLAGAVQGTITSMDQAASSPEGQKQGGAALASFESATDAMLMARVQRIAAAEWGVPPIVYIMIILGALITIGSLFVFADPTKPAWGHALVIVGPIFVVAAGLMVTYFFDNPFTTTPGGVTPLPMTMTLDYIQSDLASQGLLVPLQCQTGTATS